jgi:hypothetical protein
MGTTSTAPAAALTGGLRVASQRAGGCVVRRCFHRRRDVVLHQALYVGGVGHVVRKKAHAVQCSAVQCSAAWCGAPASCLLPPASCPASRPCLRPPAAHAPAVATPAGWSLSW